VIVDAGFDEKAGRARNYAVTRPGAEGLKQIDIDPDNVKDVILSQDVIRYIERHAKDWSPRTGKRCAGRCAPFSVTSTIRG
jgi:hypothetical protein